MKSNTYRWLFFGGVNPATKRHVGLEDLGHQVQCVSRSQALARAPDANAKGILAAPYQRGAFLVLVAFTKDQQRIDFQIGEPEIFF